MASSKSGRGAHQPGDETAATPREPLTSPSVPPLAPEEGHDAWTAGRIARSSYPPPPPDAGEDGGSAAVLDPSPAPAVAAGATGTSGDALSLVARARPSERLNLVGEMEDLFALGDFTNALRIAELVLGAHPDHERARRCADSSRERLAQIYVSKLGSFKHVPRQALDAAQSRWLGLDHRAGFLLSRIDGSMDVETLVDVSGMPRVEALKTLVELFDLGAIAVQPPA